MNLSHPIFLAAHKEDNSTKRHTSSLNNAQKLNLIKVVFRIPKLKFLISS
ncbi:anthranilate synthase [Helicobacter pylori]